MSVMHVDREPGDEGEQGVGERGEGGGVHGGRGRPMKLME